MFKATGVRHAEVALVDTGCTHTTIDERVAQLMCVHKPEITIETPQDVADAIRQQYPTVFIQTAKGILKGYKTTLRHFECGEKTYKDLSVYVANLPDYNLPLLGNELGVILGLDVLQDHIKFA